MEDPETKPPINRREFIIGLILFFGGLAGLVHHIAVPDTDQRSKSPATGYGKQGYGKGGYGGVTAESKNSPQ
jgi:hypothetical protein